MKSVSFSTVIWFIRSHKSALLQNYTLTLFRYDKVKA
jgi:hypothetical protein